jgi:peptidyl-prolyl cis-trans isomerase C
MSRILKALSALSAALLMSIALAGAVRAQDAAPAQPEAPAATPAAPVDPDTVLAKVGDTTITQREVDLAKDAFANELANVPQAQQRSVLVDAVVNMQLLAQAAHDQGLDSSSEFDAQLAFLKLQALRNAYVDKTIVGSLTDAELQQGYQDLVVKGFKPEPQVRARHILVDTKEEAEKIIGELDKGAKFEDLAKQSKDPSGQNGGDLGFFGKGQMVPEFEQAAFALEPGQYTKEPVKSQFGWHVIKVEEKRMSAPPAFTDVEGQLRNYLLRQKFDTTLTALRDKYPVQILDPTVTPLPPTDGGAPAGDAPAGDAPAGDGGTGK